MPRDKYLRKKSDKLSHTSERMSKMRTKLIIIFGEMMSFGYLDKFYFSKWQRQKHS